MPSGSLLRQTAPLVLLGLCLVVWFESWFPGSSWLHERVGDGFVLRFAVGALALYVLLLWAENMRLHASMQSLLKVLRDFRTQMGGGAAAPGADARREAARLLIGALASQDADVRRTSRQNLARLAGRDLGDDPAAWQAWWDAQAAGDRGDGGGPANG